MAIGDRIKALREERGITQTELAKILGTSKQNIYKYENNIITNIPSDKIEQMSNFFNVSPSYIMGWEIFEREAKAFEGVLDILRDIYGSVEEKSVFKYGGSIPYWVIGEGESSFILYEPDILALLDSVKGFLPPFIEKIKDIRTEKEIIKELNADLFETSKNFKVSNKKAIGNPRMKPKKLFDANNKPIPIFKAAKGGGEPEIISDGQELFNKLNKAKPDKATRKENLEVANDIMDFADEDVKRLLQNSNKAK